MCVCVYIICVCVCIYIHVCTYVYMYINVCVCLCVCIRMCRCERGESSSSGTDRGGVLRWTPNAWVRRYVLMEPIQGLNRASFSLDSLNPLNKHHIIITGQKSSSSLWSDRGESLLVQGLFAGGLRYTFPSTSKCHTKRHKHTNTHTHNVPMVLVE